jgi:integrase
MPEREALTDADIKDMVAPAKGNRIVYDAGVAGFGVRVTAAGAVAFILNYRVRGTGRERRITIGRFPNWGVGAARAEAKRLRRLIDQGADPLGEFEAEREAPTVAELIERFDEEHIGPRLRPGSAHAYRLLIKKHIGPQFGKHVKVADVQFEDVDALHRKVTKSGSPYAANRCVGVMSKMFALAVRWKMRDDNPARGVEKNTEAKRKRYLSGEELTALTKALAAHPDQQVANIMRLLLLTGARSGEVRAMRWSNLDLTKGIWSKPASTTKQKADHVVPLSAPVRQLLSNLYASQTVGGRELGPWVFPSPNNPSGHTVALSRAWAVICKKAGLSDLRIHDLRHSFASQLASGGASLPLIGALLGHSNPSTTARYAHLFDDPQRAAVEKVAAIVDNAGKDAATKPVVFPAGGRNGR